MSRRRVVEKRDILPDPKYGDKVLAKFINIIMHHGKKSVAEKIVYGALDLISNKVNGNELELFNKALENTKPIVEVKSRRVGGSTYQIPVEVSNHRSRTLAMRWLIFYAQKRQEENMGLRLANELMDAAENRGMAIKKRDDIHSMAEANKAISNFRW